MKINLNHNSHICSISICSFRSIYLFKPFPLRINFECFSCRLLLCVISKYVLTGSTSFRRRTRRLQSLIILELLVEVLSVFSSQPVHVLSVKVIVVQIVAHGARYRGAECDFKREWHPAHIDQLPLPVVVQTSHSRLIDEEVGNEAKAREQAHMLLLLIQYLVLFVVFSLWEFVFLLRRLGPRQKLFD